MKVLIAPDKFKGALSAHDAARAIALGVRDALPDANIVEVPLADGGEGTLEALGAIFPEGHRVCVTGPLGAPIEAEYAASADGTTALIETARACGLALVPANQRNPLRTTTRGVGELVRAALDGGAREIWLALGGSATCDGGAGMAAALGVEFVDSHGFAFLPVGETLANIAHVDVRHADPRLRDVRVRALCDVMLPLDGALDFLAQKGAKPGDTDVAREALTVLSFACTASGLGDRFTDAGAGAAGGLGFGAATLLDARLVSGASAVLDALNFYQHLEDADLLITGEGSFDRQTSSGKAVSEAAKRAHLLGIPVTILAGRVEEGAGLGLGEQVLQITPTGLPLDEALPQAAGFLRETSRRAVCP